ncbi:ATP-dependent DNA helicase [Trichonephila clavipes]|nr:ATP-dependent DNA helicase [Trichonephila clavipes]
MPPQILHLKFRVSIIMLRNINQRKLCNGTRLAVKKINEQHHKGNNFDRIYNGEDALIPHIPMIPTDIPFQFKRLQFPFPLVLAITNNKVQAQSLELWGLDLKTDYFSLGQLYVACSRRGVSNTRPTSM